MLIKANNMDKGKSEYICDRCKRKLKSTGRFAIYVENTWTGVKKKKYDFCEKCYEALKRGVEK